MTDFTEGQSIQLKLLDIGIRVARVDCRKLFKTNESKSAGAAPSYSLCRSAAGVLDLSMLNALRREDGKEKFLPVDLFVRDCMQDIFNELFQSPGDLNNIVFGSPGVGKSVLSFLAALCIASIGPKPVLFMRKTSVTTEPVSVFWIQKSSVEGQVDVYYDRAVHKDNTLNDIAIAMHQVGLDDHGKVKDPMPHVRVICDGPRHNDLKNLGGTGADLVTSGGHPTPKDEGEGTFRSLPLSTWTLKELIQALRALYRIKARVAKAIFDVTGGNIRAAVRIVKANKSDEALQIRRNFVDKVVKDDATGAQLKVAFESTAMSGNELSIDRLRAMVTTKGKTLNGFPQYTTVQFIGSPYLLRAVRSRLSLEETLNGLVYAKQSGIQSLYGWHFELFGHKIFQVLSEEQGKRRSKENIKGLAAVRIFEIVQGIGTGKLSVTYLKKSGTYWMPSIPNFANIDAAIVVDNVLYCIQYTVSKSHTFNYCTFASDFWGQLPAEFRKQIGSIRVVFVVPAGVTFRKVLVPLSQKALCQVHLSAQTGVVVAYRKASGSDDDQGDDDDEEEDDDQGDDSEEDDAMDVDDGTTELKIHFQWESLSEQFNVEDPPLSFLAGAEQ